RIRVIRGQIPSCGSCISWLCLSWLTFVFPVRSVVAVCGMPAVPPLSASAARTTLGLTGTLNFPTPADDAADKGPGHHLCQGRIVPVGPQSVQIFLEGRRRGRLLALWLAPLRLRARFFRGFSVGAHI